MIRYRPYKVELDPNNVQKTLFARHCGAVRKVYNWAIEKKFEAFKNKTKIPSSFDLSKEFTKIRNNPDNAWLLDIAKVSSEYAIQDTDKAINSLFQKLKLIKSGKAKKHIEINPKFRCKGVDESFRVRLSIYVESNKIKLPKIGWVRLKQSNYIPADQDKNICYATISEKCGRWYVSVTFEEEFTPPTNKPEAIVGIDLGIKTLAVCSDGKTYDKPDFTKHNRKLKILHRRLSKKQKGSKNRDKARKKLSKQYQKISRIKQYNLHQITSELTRTKSIICLEDLNVIGMMSCHNIARSIAECGFYEFKRQLQYKGLWNGCHVQLIGKRFPSSKLCSDCGWKKEDLKLKDREWVCQDCGVVHDRDLNAAINIKNEGMRIYSSSIPSVADVPSETLNVCGGSLPLVTED